MTGRRYLLLLGGTVLLAGIVLTALTAGEDPRSTDGSDQGQDRADTPAADENPDRDGGEPGSSLAPGDGGVPVTDPDNTSAAEGPQGTRVLPGPPDEFPLGVVPDDATDLEGRAARSGDSWSASVTYATATDREELERLVEAAVTSDGFERRHSTVNDARRVIVYDGPDGSIMTVTVAHDEHRGSLLAAVLVGP